MNDRSCESIAELLVAYGDGELPDAEAERVAAHLAQCPHCRSELRLLDRSLDLARQVWHESAARARAPRTEMEMETEPIPRGRRWPLAAACLAAGAALLVAAMLLYPLFRVDEPEGKTARTAPPTPARTAPPTPAREVEKTEADEEDVETIVSREARAARLAVAVELLAGQPGLEEYHQEAERYLVETYGAADRPSHDPYPRRRESVAP